jgi:hypothetical protein
MKSPVSVEGVSILSQLLNADPIDAILCKIHLFISQKHSDFQRFFPDDNSWDRLMHYLHVRVLIHGWIIQMQDVAAL